jgi:hypothetical protein
MRRWRPERGIDVLADPEPGRHRLDGWRKITDERSWRLARASDRNMTFDMARVSFIARLRHGDRASFTRSTIGRYVLR